MLPKYKDTLKKKYCAIATTLPFERYPRQLINEMVYSCVLILATMKPGQLLQDKN